MTEAFKASHNRAYLTRESSHTQAPPFQGCERMTQFQFFVKFCNSTTVCRSTAVSSASHRNCEFTSHNLNLKLDHQKLSLTKRSKLHRSNLNYESTHRRWSSRFQRLSLLLVALTGFHLGIAPTETLAEPLLTQQVAQTPQSPNTPSNIIYVSASVGDDSGDGSQQSPLRTITQALNLAQPNTAIILAPGTYSAQTGEQFPLMLRPNITVQGNPNTRGEGIIISGGGFYTSRTFAKQDIAVLGANGARISGVTVTNPNPRGYGLWVESTSMIVSNNTFTGNTHDGISIVGTAAPLIQENNFSANGANGITVFGSSRPEIRNNEFQNTGFGINISQNAAPFIAGNRIIFNKDGVVIQANARPILRDNYIERNERDGIVAIATALPDLGTTSEPGQNVIRSNGRYDINNGTKTQVIQAYGNQLTLANTTGSVQVSGNYTAPDAPSPIAQQLLASRISDDSADRSTASNNPSAISPINTSAALPVFVPEPSTSRPSTRNRRRSAETPRPVSIAVPPPETQPISTPPPVTRRSNPSPNKPLILSNLSSSPTNESTAIPITVPPPENGRVLNPYPAQNTSPQAFSTGVLPVPGSGIPISGEGYLPTGLNTGPSASPATRQLTPLRTALRGSLQYRVVIENNSERVYRQVRRVVPDAFRTVVGGRSIIQAGAFQSRYKADEVIQLLNRNGVRAKLESYN
ncbi:DUF1565 domain-containing protein [Lyngbya sp. PCC 8106]|uniref:DUF1565 domain-containing protein n=1 Tax=Lyngbya sp. (strain PCC 8106) TaxID=313612 RepID=UPI0000EAB146|nr:DUF1565 domain-containing protein [Lyngbya sp. PCC 8106]EAW39192.1 hypothetical protein L8106_04601 [Lyngbya sp. PCC 8106]